MGFGGISIWQLLIILAIVVLLFGTKRLKNIGSDLGSAVKGFKKAISDDKPKVEEQQADDTDDFKKNSAESEKPATAETVKKP